MLSIARGMRTGSREHRCSAAAAGIPLQLRSPCQVIQRSVDRLCFLFVFADLIQFLVLTGLTELFERHSIYH